MCHMAIIFFTNRQLGNFMICMIYFIKNAKYFIRLGHRF